MRILVSNPDTIGDLVLRQPMYAALAATGHELALVVRPSVTPVAPYVAPGARLISLPLEVYRDDLPEHWDQFAGVFTAAREFSPDLLVIAPYRWTLFEEKLAEELPGVRRVGMSGRLYAGDPHAGRSPRSTLSFDEAAEVDEDRHEVEKNAILASVILKSPPSAADPILRADEASLDRARQTLDALGCKPGEFWIAAVAGTAHVSLKQWRPRAWGEALSHWAATYGRRFLFVGLAQEEPIIRAVRNAMGDRADRTAVWTGSEGAGADANFQMLMALTALSAGYAGQDTGPMHVAAAMGKPVLAVFGGGNWPRFVPAVAPSCAITVGVPCAGCGWACTFSRPFCVDEVSIQQVKQAVDDLESGKISRRELRAIPASEALQARMIQEAAEKVRLQVRDAADLGQKLNHSQATLELQRLHQAELVRLHEATEARVAELKAVHVEEMSQVRQELAAQSQAILNLSGRIYALEPKPREPWKVRVAKWIAGKNYYVPLLGFRKLPAITIVTPVKDGQAWIRQTIESVMGQHYPALQYIVVDGGSTDDTLKILDEYRDRIDLIISEPDGGMYDAIGKGFDAATGDVLGYLNADDLFEPGGLLRVGEYFRDHHWSNIVYYEDTVTMEGWRFPNIAQPRVNVYELLNGHTLFQDGVFFRKSVYQRIGGINRSLKRAGDWDLWVRMARMWRLHRSPGHVSSFRIRKGQISEDRAAYEAERQAAKAQFIAHFWLPGRLRCRIVQAMNVVRNGMERLLLRRKLFWPIDYCGKPYPPGEAPPTPIDKPVSPLTGRAPDRLLFSTRDTRFGDPRIHYVYYESKTGMAMAYPPLSQDQLTELYEKHYSQPLKEVVEPDPRYHSPYKNFRGGNLIAKHISRVPSPWWFFNKITYHDDAADEILASVRNLASAENPNIRFLDVGCFEGGLLDQLKSRTKWKLFGLEANANAVQATRAKGHQVWQATAEDAALVVPEETSFDLIFLGQTMEHLDDPLIALNRLRLLLAPGGAIVVSLPNLDSKQVELFGPTWAHWHMPYHRTLLSRRALRRMAQLAGMRVRRLRTRTHPYWTTMTIQLNRLGLGAVVPHSAYFSNVMAMHGTRLTGWCRLLWDWRGRGDYMFAVLENQ